MIRNCLLILLIPTIALAQNRSPQAEEDPLRDLDAAMARGLAYLARQQNPDGSFQNRDGDNKLTGPKVALTGLCVTAFLSAGRMPGSGKHGLSVGNAIDFLVKSCPQDGYYGKVDGSRMYGHAIATLALAEAYGTQSDARQRQRVREALERAVRVLLEAQNAPKPEPERGGWRYEPASGDSDLSVTAWCAVALRAARDAGIEVPASASDHAAEYVLRCYRPEKKGFAYQRGGEPSASMTGAAVLCLHLLERSNRQETSVGAQYLLDHRIDERTPYPYYAIYYATHAAFQNGGEAQRRIWRRTRNALLGNGPMNQQKDGAWPASRSANEPGQTYATALAILTLSIPLELLPTYQH